MNIHIFYLFIYIWWNTRYYDVYPLLRKENNINRNSNYQKTLYCVRKIKTSAEY